MSNESVSVATDEQGDGVGLPIGNNQKGSKKLGLIPLMALIVGSSVGGGIFNATTGIAGSAGPGIALLSWLVVGAGILLLVLAINNIIKRTPALIEANPALEGSLKDGGLVGYADAGFGRFWGLMSGWGYWLSAWLGNVAFAALLLSAFGGLGGTGGLISGENASWFEAGNIMPFMFVSLIMWFLVLLVTRGIQSAAIINAVVLIAKFVPLILVLIMCFVAFKSGVFTAGFWQNVAGNDMFGANGADNWASLSGGFMTMIWCFVGIEGACMFADKAKNPKSVSKATNMGFILLLVIYMALSVLPYGVFSQAELADLDAPALGYVLQEAFGGSSAGLYIVNIGLIISLLGAWLSWTLLPVQTLEVMEKQSYIPQRFAKKNEAGVPVFSLVVTTICAQVFMLVFLFPKLAIADTAPYDFFVYLCGNAILVTWLFAALYQIRISVKEKNTGKLILNTAIGVLAAAFQIFMILAVGGWLFLTMFITYVPAFGLFYARRKKDVANKIAEANANGTTLESKDKKLFTTLEVVFMSIVTMVAIVSVALVASGTVDIWAVI